MSATTEAPHICHARCLLAAKDGSHYLAMECNRDPDTGWFYYVEGERPSDTAQDVGIAEEREVAHPMSQEHAEAFYTTCYLDYMASGCYRIVAAGVPVDGSPMASPLDGLALVAPRWNQCRDGRARHHRRAPDGALSGADHARA